MLQKLTLFFFAYYYLRAQQIFMLQEIDVASCRGTSYTKMSSLQLAFSLHSGQTSPPISQNFEFESVQKFTGPRCPEGPDKPNFTWMIVISFWPHIQLNKELKFKFPHLSAFLFAKLWWKLRTRRSFATFSHEDICRHSINACACCDWANQIFSFYCPFTIPCRSTKSFFVCMCLCVR